MRITHVPTTVVPHTHALRDVSNVLGTVMSVRAKQVLNYALLYTSTPRMVGAMTSVVGAKRHCRFLQSFVFARPDVGRKLGVLFGPF